MPRAGRAGLARLELLEEPQAWAALGFSIDAAARCAIGNTEVVLRGGAGGIAAWGLSGLSSVELDGLPTMLDARPSPARAQSAVHPNGCVGIDHVVVRTPDPSRTFGTLERAGLELRRTRDVPGAHPPLVQGFLPLANALVEVVGPREPDAAEGRAPASFWGVTLVVVDLDATAQLLGDRVGPVRDAVQPGRRIATVRASAAAIRTPLAFMSPRA